MTHIDKLVDETPIPKGETWRPIEWAHLLAGDVADEKPSILLRSDGPGLLYRGRLHSLYAEPEGMKTWVALEACRQEIEVDNPVLYVDFEDNQRGVLARLRSLGVEDNTIEKRFGYIRPAERLNLQAWEHLDAVLSHQPSLVICDGVTEAMVLEGLNLVDNRDVAEFLERLPRRITRAGPAVLLLDHVGRNKDARGRFAIGAQAKLAGIDGAAYSIEVSEPFGRNKTGRARLQLQKDRIGFVSEHSIGSKRDIAAVIATSMDGKVEIHLEPPADPEKWKPTRLMELVSEAVETTPGMTTNQLVSLVNGRREYKIQAISNLVAEWYVRTEPGPRNALLHHSEKPYREPQP